MRETRRERRGSGAALGRQIHRERPNKRNMAKIKNMTKDSREADAWSHCIPWRKAKLPVQPVSSRRAVHGVSLHSFLSIMQKCSASYAMKP
ncbi:hypothetical protein IF1G_01463 [Cordyceps javanica]|uniref:Uncharacterized protein n=1 Tax=Cordyceps javanica TaxID=43265 RepID=A0A545VC14_9HYPO|nr:hypothetical protein IF1G_01463 [Cordyceps javanica]